MGRRSASIPNKGCNISGSNWVGQVRAAQGRDSSAPAPELSHAELKKTPFPAFPHSACLIKQADELSENRGGSGLLCLLFVCFGKKEVEEAE